MRSLLNLHQLASVFQRARGSSLSKPIQRPRRRALQLVELEDRVVFNAAGGGVLLIDAGTNAPTAPVAHANTVSSPAAHSGSTSNTPATVAPSTTSILAQPYATVAHNGAGHTLIGWTQHQGGNSDVRVTR